MKNCPLPTPGKQARSGGWAFQAEAAVGGVGGGGRTGGMCARGPPRFGGCGPRWAFHAKRRDRLEHEVLIWGLESEFLEIFIIVLKLSVCLFIFHKLFKDTCDPPVF